MFYISEHIFIYLFFLMWQKKIDPLTLLAYVLNSGKVKQIAAQF